MVTSWWNGTFQLRPGVLSNSVALTATQSSPRTAFANARKRTGRGGADGGKFERVTHAALSPRQAGEQRFDRLGESLKGKFIGRVRYSSVPVGGE